LVAHALCILSGNQTAPPRPIFNPISTSIQPKTIDYWYQNFHAPGNKNITLTADM
jgi:hypothetical protein